MKELLIILSKSMPEEMLMQELKEATESYITDQNKESKSKLSMFCMMVACRFSTEQHDSHELITEFEKRDKARDMYKNMFDNKQ